jgi:hypothetical protein
MLLRIGLTPSCINGWNLRLPNEITPWDSGLLEKFVFAYLLRKFSTFVAQKVHNLTSTSICSKKLVASRFSDNFLSLRNLLCMCATCTAHQIFVNVCNTLWFYRILSTNIEFPIKLSSSCSISSRKVTIHCLNAIFRTLWGAAEEWVTYVIFLVLNVVGEKRRTLLLIK